MAPLARMSGQGIRLGNGVAVHGSGALRSATRASSRRPRPWPWLERAPVRLKLAAMIGAFMATVVALLVLMALSLKLSNAVRAYVAGEGFWSRAQQDAVFALDRYSRSRDEADWREYLDARRVILGDRAARVELQKPGGGAELVATEGFAAGRNDPLDIPDMIFLFRWFEDAPYLRDGIAIWAEADLHVDRLHALALRVRAGEPAPQAELHEIEAVLTDLEVRFSARLSEGARWVHRTLLLGSIGLAGLMLLGAAVLGRRVAFQLRAGIGALQAGTARVAAGDLRSPIPVRADDELGALARDFNGMIEHRRGASEALEHRLAFETLLTRLSSAMTTLTPARVDQGINRALADIGEFAQVDRSYVFLFDDTYTTVTCSHEWCAPGVPSQIGRLQDLPVADFPWVEARLQRGEVVHVPRVADLPPEAAAERAEWEAESIQSLLLIPMRTGDAIRGYVGFDSVRAEKSWPQESNDLLRIFGEIVLGTLTRVKAEQALRERNETLAEAVAELERSNAELEQFAYVASHDLNTPLRGIHGFIQLLRRRLPADAKAEEYVSLALDSVAQMQSLIAGLLAMSRIGRGSPAPVPTDCEAVLADVENQLAALITERKVAVTHDPLPTLPATPLEIKQVFQNLVANAIKFQPGPAPRVHVSALRDGPFWQFSVRDWGIGIRRDHHPRIFQLFQRLHSADRYEGSGIGLAICRKIVQRHGGRIWLESEEGQGSTFYFTLKA